MSQTHEEAKAKFLAKAGHHDTTVHEEVLPAVVQEHRHYKQHEVVETVVDKEIHQNHYHTSIQPIHDQEVLPEIHKHNLVAVEERKFTHGDEKEIELRRNEPLREYQSKVIEDEVEHTHSVAPAVAGEHIHHHVYERILPWVQREVSQVTVVHTTVPVHEVHYNEAKFHSTSALPAVSMADFKKQGGTLTGREERYDGFQGEPKSVGGALGAPVDSTTSTTKTHSHSASGGSVKAKIDPRIDSDGDGKRGFLK